MEAVGNSIAGAGTKMMGVTTVIGGVGVAAVKTAADFDSAMSQVAAVSGATGKDFDDDALIFDEKQISAVDLLDNAQEPVVSILFNAPAVGIWSPTGKNAPFICLEPWYGIHDWHQFAGEFKDKYLMNKLLPGASFVSRYDIVIHKA